MSEPSNKTLAWERVQLTFKAASGLSVGFVAGCLPEIRPRTAGGDGDARLSSAIFAHRFGLTVGVPRTDHVQQAPCFKMSCVRALPLLAVINNDGVQFPQGALLKSIQLGAQFSRLDISANSAWQFLKREDEATRGNLVCSGRPRVYKRARPSGQNENPGQ